MLKNSVSAISSLVNCLGLHETQKAGSVLTLELTLPFVEPIPPEKLVPRILGQHILALNINLRLRNGQVLILTFRELSAQESRR